MLVDALIDMLYSLIDWITSGLNIPQLPDGVADVLANFVQYVATGIAILSNYTHMDYLLILFGVVVGVEAAILIYKFIMWIIRKIPMLGIS